ncbi:MAG: hypothetical protein QNJ71_08980 [Acidimicrobiia bacterium]|nr:hypothetical protein [Acidimicrobiia bacterium]
MGDHQYAPGAIPFMDESESGTPSEVPIVTASMRTAKETIR